MIHYDNDNAALPGAGGPAGRAAAGAPRAVGRWALALAVALLAAFAGVNLLHRQRGQTPAALEAILQEPVPADDPTFDNRPEVTAPDPGDNP